MNGPDKCGYYRDWQREKFIELIQAAVDGCAKYWAGKIADHLIANGATIQQWIDAEKDPPKNFVSVLGYMSDAEPFPTVRECYTVEDKFYFPALNEYHPVKKWTPLLNPPKEVVEK